MNFGVIGVGGYIAPRHLNAIKANGNRVVAALDKHDSVGILDSYFPEAAFFTEFERFDRHVEKLRRTGEASRIHYMSICSPNYLHDAHIRFALRVHAHPVCEKPLVINPWNVDALEELEKDYGQKIYCVLQLRLHPALISLKEKIEKEPQAGRHAIDMTYITSRGRWYFSSWKGDPAKSGGIATNIRIHFFDMLMWIF
jgi:UDP-N-acetyl-2-amino-2-deoxyglucuronate dehydrogenase